MKTFILVEAIENEISCPLVCDSYEEARNRMDTRYHYMCDDIHEDNLIVLGDSTSHGYAHGTDITGERFCIWKIFDVAIDKFALIKISDDVIFEPKCFGCVDDAYNCMYDDYISVCNSKICDSDITHIGAYHYDNETDVATVWEICGIM